MKIRTDNHRQSLFYNNIMSSWILFSVISVLIKDRKQIMNDYSMQTVWNQVIPYNYMKLVISDFALSVFICIFINRYIWLLYTAPDLEPSLTHPKLEAQTGTVIQAVLPAGVWPWCCQEITLYCFGWFVFSEVIQMLWMCVCVRWKLTHGPTYCPSDDRKLCVLCSLWFALGLVQPPQ